MVLAGYFVFNNTYLTIGGGIISGFGIYMIVAHFLSLYIFTGVDGTRFAWIAELLELKGNEYALDVGSLLTQTVSSTIPQHLID